MKTITYIAEGGRVRKTVSDMPEPSRFDILRTNLTIMVTAYDYSIRQRAARNPCVYHNGFALALYMEAIDRVMHSLTFEGVTLIQALNENFTGHMLSYLLRKAAR